MTETKFKSIFYISISTILIIILFTASAYSTEPFSPVMPTTLHLAPSGTTTSSTPMIMVIGDHSQLQQPMGLWTSTDQVQIYIYSATQVYLDAWYAPSEFNLSCIPPVITEIPTGTNYYIAVRGWNNANGGTFGPWTTSNLNTVVERGTDCYSNSQRYIDGQGIVQNPACQ